MTILRGPQTNPRAVTLPKFSLAPVSMLASIPDVNFLVPQNLTVYPATSSSISIGISLIADFGQNISNDLVFSLGTNPAADNIFSAQTATNFRSTNNAFTKWLAFQKAVKINPGDIVVFKITTGASGNQNSILMGKCNLLGFLA